MNHPGLDHAARQTLLRRARAAIASTIGAEIEQPAATATPPAVRAGAFVTLRVGGDLRLLVEVVERCAISAAVSDPRFPAVSVSEWPLINLEISVLGPLERVHDIGEIEIGRHGLVVQLGKRHGLLLPQVAVEWKWDREEFASHTCVKAGIERDAWRTGATLLKFEAEVFGENT
jgi:uncharacterized protein